MSQPLPSTTSGSFASEGTQASSSSPITAPLFTGASSSVPLLASSLSFPASSEGHPLLDSVKLSQHVWRELISPLLMGSSPHTESALAPLACSFAENGDLKVVLKGEAFTEEDLLNLRGRLEQNLRLKELDFSPHEGTLSFNIPSYRLPHLFFQAKDLLMQLAETHPSLKTALNGLISGIPVDDLLTTELQERQAFLQQSLPGDYIVSKIPTGFLVEYKNLKGEIKSCTFSLQFGAFSSFAGFSEFSRPFHFRSSSLSDTARAHNGFLHFKNQLVIHSLKRYSGQEMNNYAVGGVDHLIELEDMLAWHEFLPEGKVKNDLFRELLPYCSILLAHFNSLKGQALATSKPVSLEGMRRPPAKGEVTESALRYLPKSRILSDKHRNILFRMFNNAVRFSNKSDYVISNKDGGVGDAKARFDLRNAEILAELAEGIPVSISSGWAKHNIEVTLIQNEQGTFLLYTNKGQTLHPDNRTRLYRVTKPLTAEMIGHIRKRPAMGPLGESHGTYFHAPKQVLDIIKLQLGGTRPETMEEEFGLELISMIPKKPQKVGNCSVANGKEMIYNAVFLLHFVESLGAMPPSEAAKFAASRANPVSKEYQLNQRVYQIGVWKHLGKFLMLQPDLAKQHFELFQAITTKYVNNKKKIDNLLAYAQSHVSLIPKGMEDLQAAMAAFVKESSCDIAACTGPIAFSGEGNRIKRGPNGSFGIYKSKDFATPSPANPVMHLVTKNLEGKFAIIHIFPAESQENGRYKIELGEQGPFFFTTLGQLARKMDEMGQGMVFAL